MLRPACEWGQGRDREGREGREGGGEREEKRGKEGGREAFVKFNGTIFVFVSFSSHPHDLTHLNLKTCGNCIHASKQRRVGKEKRFYIHFPPLLHIPALLVFYGQAAFLKLLVSKNDN